VIAPKFPWQVISSAIAMLENIRPVLSPINVIAATPEIDFSIIVKVFVKDYSY
jgi:hypothetical protein